MSSRGTVTSPALTEIPQRIPMIAEPQPDHDPLHRRDAQERTIAIHRFTISMPQLRDSLPLFESDTDSPERIHPDGWDEQPDSDYERGDLASDDIDCHTKTCIMDQYLWRGHEASFVRLHAANYVRGTTDQLLVYALN
jgi:hypothetical protein